MKKTILAEFSSLDMAEQAAHLIKSNCKNVDGIRITAKSNGEFHTENDAVFSNFFAPVSYAQSGIPLTNGIMPEAFNLPAAAQKHSDEENAANRKKASLEVSTFDGSTKSPAAIIRSLGGTDVKEY